MRSKSLHVAIALAAIAISTRASAQLVAPKEHTPPPVSLPEGVPAQDVVVVLKLTIGTDGKVTKIGVKSRTPADAPDAYVDKAIEYAQPLEFDPATKDGAAIESKIEYAVKFAAPAPPPAPPPPPAPAPAPTPKNEVAAALGEEQEPGKHEATEAEITIPGRTEPRSHGVSDHHVHVGALAIVPHINATDFLKLAPGVFTTNEGGEGHAEQIFMRGFDAREGQDVELTVGGVPINDSGNIHGNGYADTHFIMPELISSLRVLEGPFAPQQGNYAVAGSADYELGLEQRGLTTKYTIGSFGTERFAVLWGPGTNTHTFGGAEIYKTDGWGANREAKRGTAMAQYEGGIGEKGTFRLTGTAYATSFHTPGVVREDDYDAGRIGFFGTYDPRQGGDASRFSIAADFEGGEGDVVWRQLLFVVDRTMRLRENFTGFIEDDQQPWQSPHGQRGDMIDLFYDGQTIGARGFARFKGKAFGLPQELELGYFARGDHAIATQYRLAAATGDPYHVDADLDSKLGDLGLWADANLKLSKWLTLRGGMRADVFTFDVKNNCAVQSLAVVTPGTTNDASCFSQDAGGQYREPVEHVSAAATGLMPRATLILGKFQGFNFSFSYGKGIRSIDPIYVTPDMDTPFAQIKSYEGGVGYVRSTEKFVLTARSIFFQTHVDRDLVFSATEGRATLANGTTRTGWVGAARATGDFFDESASVTLVRATFDDTHESLPYVPSFLARSDTAFFHDLPFTLDGAAVRGAIGAGFGWIGRRPLPDGAQSDVIVSVDTSASLAWRGLSLALSVTNLLDRRQRLSEFNYASDFHTGGPTDVPMRHFIGAPPRSVFLTLSATVGGP
jgi:hypothetical protein